MVKPSSVEVVKKSYTGPRIDKVHTCLLCETRDDPTPPSSSNNQKPIQVKTVPKDQPRVQVVARVQNEMVKPSIEMVRPSVEVVKPSMELVKPSVEVVKKSYTGPRIDKVHTCLLCETRDGRNLSFASGLSELRNHYSVCFYNRGQFVGVADPGEENRDPETGKAVDEYGRKYKYKCSVPACPRNQNKAKSCGFKEWVIHAGVAHHLVERVMEVESEKNPPMKE